MSTFADRLLNRLVPKRTAWACRVQLCGHTQTRDRHNCCSTTGQCSPCPC